MKKTTALVGIVALVGVAYVGSAWYVGKEAQAMITQAVAQTNERAVKMLGPDLNSTHFNVEIRSYERGLFSSSAQYVLHTLDSEGNALEYVLQDTLQHGPFPLSALKAGKFSPMLAHSQANMVVTPAIEKWFDLRQGQTPLGIETQVGFGGRGTSHWTFAPFETSREQRRVSFSGGHVRVVFEEGFNNNVASGHFDTYVLTDTASGEKVEVRDITLDSTTSMVADGEFEHQSKALVKALTVADTSTDASAIEINDLNVTLTSVQKAGLLDAGLRYDAARILFEGADLGEMTAAGAFTRLNLDAIAELQAVYAEMAEKRGPDTEPGFMLTNEEQLILQNLLRPVLAAGPTLSLEPVIWKNASGQSRASAFIATRDPGESEDANAAKLLQDMIDNAKLELAVERSMVVETFQKIGVLDDIDRTQAGEFGGQLFDEYADLLTRMGLTQLNDNTLTLSLDASPAEDKITLNGKTMTTEQLLMLALGLMFLR